MDKENKYFTAMIEYCDAIKSKKILSGIYTQKAIKRFLNDLKESKSESFPYYFDESRAFEICEFAETLKLPDLNGNTLKLLPWQIFILANLYGWYYKGDSERRRYRHFFVMVGRKNGKTAGILFPLILYDFLTSPAAEAYMFSGNLDQSNKSFQEIVKTINADPDLKEACRPTVSAITTGNSRIAFFSADAVSIDGYKNSLTILDEYWVYDSNKPWTSGDYGGRARKNSLVGAITTAGDDISKPCYTEVEKVHKILNGILTDDSYFCITYEYDQDDKWNNPDLLIKANPSLGTILQKDILLADLHDAEITPSHQAEFIAKTCNIFQQGVSSWIPIQKLQQNKDYKIDEEKLLNKTCTSAFDLSEVGDWTAFSLCFKYDDKYYLKHHFWLPEETLNDRYKKENINIKEWIAEGYITVIPGATVDYAYVFDYIKECSSKYNITELAYDPWHSNELIKKIEDEIPNITEIPVEQSLKSMSPLTQSFEKYMLDGKIIELSPILMWMYGNVVIKKDINGNYKPLKVSKSNTQRIDAVITSIMSFNRFIAGAEDNTRQISFKQLMNSF